MATNCEGCRSAFFSPGQRWPNSLQKIASNYLLESFLLDAEPLDPTIPTQDTSYGTSTRRLHGGRVGSHMVTPLFRPLTLSFFYFACYAN